MSNDMSDMINNMKKMIDNGEVNDMIKNLPPDFMNNFSNMTNSNSSNNSSSNSSNNSNVSSNSQSNFNFDMNTILKMKSIIENMNNSNDPRANLLYSLKPYLRDTKKDKLDQYVNMLNMAKIADVLKNENNSSSK